MTTPLPFEPQFRFGLCSHLHSITAILIQWPFFVCGLQTLPWHRDATLTGSPVYRLFVKTYFKSYSYIWDTRTDLIWNICELLNTSKLKFDERRCNLGRLVQHITVVFETQCHNNISTFFAQCFYNVLGHCTVKRPTFARYSSWFISLISISSRSSSGYFGFATAHGCTTSSFG